MSPVMRRRIPGRELAAVLVRGVILMANSKSLVSAMDVVERAIADLVSTRSGQAQGADQIREAVVHLSDGMNQALISLREFNQATAQLREAVGGLKDEVSRFRVDPTPS